MKKAKIRKDAIVPYKVLRRPSPLPYILAGAVILLIGSRGLIRPFDYIKCAGLGLLGYYVGRGIWPDKKIRVELPPNTGDQQADQLLSEARAALTAIHTANDRIADAAVSAQIERVETACIKILARLEEQPALHGQLRTFLRYYLPTTRKLLDARAAIEGGDLSGDSARRVQERADLVLPAIAGAFEKQFEALDKHRYLDLQVEMDVLEGMLKSDGLTQ
ncbi:MAG: 5-bromo-4-chloroindolyl phosphate hydrolysis family protein [Oscillospiraceae bacterium]|jgi:hypothetical protein|nr:5-bromo-4-chloroindolyl phosphate hydrolysis family protein [Oscillospiraceae bacterium]